MGKSLDFVLGQPWAMLPDMVETLVSIADRTNLDPEAVAAKLGRPLDNTQKVQMRDSVAVIPVRGPIARYGSIFSEVSGSTSLDVLARDINASLDSPDVRGIVLEIDSPGGQAAGIGELAAMIRAGTRKKPIYAYVSNMGASAALWLAAGASRVILAPSAVMGSMGVVWAMPLPRKGDEGPREIEFVSSQSPNKRPNLETKDGKAAIQEIVDKMAQVFVEAVASYRGLKPEAAIAQFGRGGLLVGGDAVAAGMADGLGTLESVIEELNNYQPQQDNGMKINFPKAITAWLSKGSPEVMEIAPQEDAAAGAGTELESNSVPNVAEFTELKVNTTVLDAEIAKVKAELEAVHKAEMRNSRLELFTLNSNAFLDLHSDRVEPKDRPALLRGLVAAAMLDAENPIEGASFYADFKGMVSSRQPHGASRETIVGDAAQVADKLNAAGLKVLPNAVATEEDVKRQKDEDARLDLLLSYTDEGRAVLASQDK